MDRCVRGDIEREIVAQLRARIAQTAPDICCDQAHESIDVVGIESGPFM